MCDVPQGVLLCISWSYLVCSSKSPGCVVSFNCKIAHCKNLGLWTNNMRGGCTGCTGRFVGAVAGIVQLCNLCAHCIQWVRTQFSFPVWFNTRANITRRWCIVFWSCVTPHTVKLPAICRSLLVSFLGFCSKKKLNVCVKNKIKNDLSCGAQVVVCSCMTSGILRDGGYGSYHKNVLVTEPLDFDIVMVDEAGQVRCWTAFESVTGQSCPTHDCWHLSNVATWIMCSVGWVWMHILIWQLPSSWHILV